MDVRAVPTLKVSSSPSWLPTTITRQQIVVAVALAALAAFVISYLFKKARPISALPPLAQEMVPNGEVIKKAEPIKTGLSKNSWVITTNKNRYVFQQLNQATDEFQRIAATCSNAARLGLGPEVIDSRINERAQLFEYIEQKPWPSYDQNHQLYRDAIIRLRVFHNRMPRPQVDNSTIFAPFGLILDGGGNLKKAELPHYFFTALGAVQEIYNRLSPQLQKNHVLCHGDFHRENLILSENDGVFIVDYDHVAVGDPLFDVVKFCAPLPQKDQIELFRWYLNKQNPERAELAHFQLMQLVFLMVVATNRFRLAQHSKDQSRLSKEAMQQLLDSEEPSPSYLSVKLTKETPVIALQKSAIYALKEFSERLFEFGGLNRLFSSL